MTVRTHKLTHSSTDDRGLKAECPNCLLTLRPQSDGFFKCPAINGESRSRCVTQGRFTVQDIDDEQNRTHLKLVVFEDDLLLEKINEANQLSGLPPLSMG
jgi:hypothetical protein